MLHFYRNYNFDSLLKNPFQFTRLYMLFICNTMFYYVLHLIAVEFKGSCRFLSFGQVECACKKKRPLPSAYLVMKKHDS